MVNQSTQYVQGPKIDWTEDAGLHQQFKDWREEVELLLDMSCPASEISKPSSSMSVYGLEKKKISEHSLSEDSKDSVTMLDTLKD